MSHICLSLIYWSSFFVYVNILTRRLLEVRDFSFVFFFKVASTLSGRLSKCCCLLVSKYLVAAPKNISKSRIESRLTFSFTSLIQSNNRPISELETTVVGVRFVLRFLLAPLGKCGDLRLSESAPLSVPVEAGEWLKKELLENGLMYVMNYR